MTTNTQTYYRIHPAHEPVERLLSPERWESRAWVGEYTRRCPADCDYGQVLHIDDHGDAWREMCEVCRGDGEVEDVRRGVSVCASIPVLAQYLADREWGRAAVVVELEGAMSDDADHEADEGADLIIPTRIVAVYSLEESGLMEAIRAES